MLATRANMRGARTVIVFVVVNLEKQNRRALHKTRRNPQRFSSTFTPKSSTLKSNRLANKTLHFKNVGLTL